MNQASPIRDESPSDATDEPVAFDPEPPSAVAGTSTEGGDHPAAEDEAVEPADPEGATGRIYGPL